MMENDGIGDEILDDIEENLEVDENGDEHPLENS